MFGRLVEKLNNFASHHQFFFAALIALSIICISWGVERILDHYIFPRKKLMDYVIAIFGGLILFLCVQHFVLHVL